MLSRFFCFAFWGCCLELVCGADFTASHPLLISMMIYYINSPKPLARPPQLRLFWKSLQTLDSSPELCQSLGKKAKCLLHLLSPKHKERKQLFRSMQTKPSLWVADALGTACTRALFSLFRHHNPCRAASFLCSLRVVEVSVLFVKFRLHGDFCLACTQFLFGKKKEKLMQGTDRQLKSLTVPMCIRGGGADCVQLVWIFTFH